MTNYTSNEQYEKDKAALIRIAEGTSMGSLIQNADVIAEFLKQSVDPVLVVCSFTHPNPPPL